MYDRDRGASAMVVIVSDMTRFPNADSGAVIDGAVGGAKGSAQTTVSDTISTVDGQVGRGRGADRQGLQSTSRTSSSL